MQIHPPVVAALALALGVSACGDAADAPPEKAPAEKAASEAPPAQAQTAQGGSALEEIETPGAARDAVTAYRSDTTDIPVAAAGSPGDRLEFKLRMKAGDTVTYAWTADEGADLWHEFHGHTAEKVAFYKKAAGVEHRGVLVAPFDGIHGWYFENRSPKVVVVRMRTGGFYELAPDADG